MEQKIIGMFEVDVKIHFSPPIYKLIPFQSLFFFLI